MSSIISLEFPYHGDQHYVLISCKQLAEKIQYRFKIMDVELERIINDCNTIEEDHGMLLLDDCHGDKEKLELKKSITAALAEYLHKDVIAKDDGDNW
jgi:hypothetical protein